jgi:hypothetical protein
MLPHEGDDAPPGTGGLLRTIHEWTGQHAPMCPGSKRGCSASELRQVDVLPGGYATEEVRGAEATAWAEQKVALLLTGEKRKHDVKRELVKRLASVLTPDGFAATRRVVATRIASSLLLHYVLFDELARDNELSVSFGIRVVNDARASRLAGARGDAADLP